MDGYGKDQAGIGQIGIVFLYERRFHQSAGIPDLVIIAVFPKDADTNEVLFELKGAAQVLTG